MAFGIPKRVRCRWKALLAVLALMPMADAAFAQSSVPPPNKTAVTTNGLVADFYAPADAQGPLPAVIVLGGSGGGMDERTAWEARGLAQHGYVTLQLAYFLAPGLPTALHLIPLEYFKTAVDWLRAQPGVDPERIGIVGTSIGGMAALVLAAHYPEFKVIVAAVPSSVIWTTFGSSRTSMFSLEGQPLPYLPHGLSGGSRIYDLYDEGLNSIAQHPDAVIPVERINGPVMLICGKLDALWPSCRMSAQVIARLEANGFQYAFQLLEYADGGHSVFGSSVATESPASGSRERRGGGPASNHAARIDSWPKAVTFIDAALKPGPSSKP
jgi:dienelactone hydrolase